MSFLAMIDEMPVFGDFDKASNTPTVFFDPRELVNTVALLWENAKKQRLVMEAMEKEMAKRKTETEVRLRTLQSDLEGLVKNEAKRREQEDDSIRADMVRLQTKIDGDLRAVDSEAREREGDLQRSVDRTTGAIKAGLLDTQEKVSSLSVEVDELRKELESLRANNGNVSMDQVLKVIDQKHGLICSFIGATPDGVAAAVKNGKEKESFLRVPALSDLASRIKTTETVANTAMNDVRVVEEAVGDLSKDVKNIKGELPTIRESIKDSEVRVTDGFGEGDRKLHKRIDELSGRFVSSPSQGGQSVSTAIDTYGPAISELRDEIAEIAKRLRKVEGEMVEKASIKELDAKANLTDLDPIWEAIHKLVGMVDSHDAEIKLLKERPSQIVNNRVEVPAKPTERLIEPSPPRDDPRIGEILVRLADAERMCGHLDEVKADKNEVNAALKDLMKRIEKALNALLARIQDLEATTLPADATAGRFRCLSCNRNAGPLQEQLSERMSSQQFPPSTVYSQGQRPQSATTRPSSATIPGMRDYGGGMTSSRKKLMNYYSWLQDRADSPGQSTQPNEQRARSPGLKHPWSGAQSGNGEFGERQCGDHGSVEPDAIGSDGKYYVGVHSRPQSATKRNDATV